MSKRGASPKSDKMPSMSAHRWLVVAAIFGCTAGACYSQNKSACQLTTTSALEVLTQYKYEQPQSQPVEDDLIPFKDFPPIIGSSACSYKIAASDPRSGDSGVRLAVWYMQRTDPENAKEAFLREQARNYRGRQGVNGIGYPAVYTAVNSSLYVFKSVTPGLMVLRVTGPVGVVRSLAEVLEPEKKVAVGLLGPPAELSGVVPKDKIIDPSEVLRGQTGMSVEIKITGIRDIPESTYRADIIDQLERIGITVFPRNDPPKFPALTLKVDAILGRLIGSTPFRKCCPGARRRCHASDPAHASESSAKWHAPIDTPTDSRHHHEQRSDLHHHRARLAGSGLCATIQSRKRCGGRPLIPIPRCTIRPVWASSPGELDLPLVQSGVEAGTTGDGMLDGEVTISS